MISIFHSSGIGTLVMYMAITIPGNKNMGPDSSSSSISLVSREPERGSQMRERESALPPYSPDQCPS